jgi:mannose-1-phosphate guanylyltransferase
LSTTSIYRKRVTPLPVNFITMSGIARMATRGSTARQRTVSESAARNTGESIASARQIEKEARVDSEVTPGDTEDVVANQRAFIQALVERQAAMQDKMAEQRASMQADMAK